MTSTTIGEAVGARLGSGARPTCKARRYPTLRASTPDPEHGSADLWLLTHPDSRHPRCIAALYRTIAKTIRLD